jgi:GH15 family glucan-1,4-alpha-glucosidase
MAYAPIESYGVIGNMHSVALISMDGSIDWCCLPHFDSPSVFAAILDDRKGGSFSITVTSETRHKQMYLPETNVLVTRFLAADGVGEVTDFMPVQDGAGEFPCHQIIRMVKGVRGAVPFRMECRPAFDFARRSHELALGPRRALFSSAGDQLMLLADRVELRGETGAAVADFVLRPNETAIFVLQHGKFDSALEADLAGFVARSLEDTIARWKNWVAHCRYAGRWREMLIRSALVLKLLTFRPTGAVVAAATCSLPEEIGGVRNWDYRYTWIRDAAFTIFAFLRLGFYEEAARFMDWLQERAREDAQSVQGPLQIMYGIDGRHDLAEFALDHLDGYRGSKPVRVGNAASTQLQLDVYGELIDSIYLYNKYAQPVSYDLWQSLRRMLDWVCANWEQPDHGIWEVRGGPRHFVNSKMQCWVALDRGLRIAQKRGLPVDDQRLRQQSHRIYETVMQHGWNEKRQAFTQSFDSDAVDASTLLLPLMLFVSPRDPRMLATLDRIQQELVSDSLVYRYELGRAAGDGLPGREGTFSVCTFWMVEALARAGRVDEARLIFEKMLTYANHLGLYAEEIGPRGEALGNFPQAFTHLGLISAAYDLDRSLNARAAG